MIYYAILIPIFISFLGWVLYKRQVTWWELLLAPTISFLLIVISYYSMKSYTLTDVEYNGHLIVDAAYYEPYDTWVKKTCSYTTCSGSGKSRSCTTHYYDCSYCDHIEARYVMADVEGNTIEISRDKYLALKQQWHSTPQFLELNRDINYHGDCGKDGDAYTIKWDGKRSSSETHTTTHEFTNILKCNHSAFNYPEVKPELAKKAGLFDYPEIGTYEYQKSVLGLHNTKLTKYLDYLNGAYGTKYKLRIYTLFFKDKPLSTSFLQEAYFDGGNQNEIIVCIGLDKANKITWVRPFSFCDNKLVLVDIRDDLMEAKTINEEVFYTTYMNAIKKSWHFKSFKDFNYLSFEPTEGQLWFVYVMTTLVSMGLIAWSITNEENNDNE